METNNMAGRTDELRLRKHSHVLFGVLAFVTIVVAAILFGVWAGKSRVDDQRATIASALAHIRDDLLRDFAGVAALQHGIGNVIAEQRGAVSEIAFDRLVEDFLIRNENVAAAAILDSNGIRFSHGYNRAALDWLYHGAAWQDPAELVNRRAAVSLVTADPKEDGGYFIGLLQPLPPSGQGDTVNPGRRSLVVVINIAALFASTVSEASQFGVVCAIVDRDGHVALGAPAVGAIEAGRADQLVTLPVDAYWPGPTELRLLPADWVLAGMPKSGWGFSLSQRIGIYVLTGLSGLCAFSVVLLALYFSWTRGKSNDQLKVSTTALSSRDRRLAYLAEHDEATGLRNYRYLEMWRRGQVGRPGPFSVMLIDIHRFKNVNLTHGPDVGNRVLATIGARLREVLDASSIAVRIGGDKFIIIFAEAILEDKKPAMLQEVVDAVEMPVAIDDHTIRLGTVIGIAVGAIGDEDRTEMLGRADIALTAASETGRGSVCFFDETMRRRSADIRQIADDIVSAIEDDQLVVFFQPQLRAITHAVTGAEALVRWQHPTRGILTPDSFMPAAEMMNLTSRIDAIVLRKTLEHLKAWDGAGLFLPRLSVNVSGPRLASPDLMEDLDGLDLPPGRLAFEVLESVYLDDGNAAMVNNLAALRARGIEIEVDDFGTGFASIISLLRLRPSRLKIDRQLISPIIADEAQRQVIAAIVDIARARNVGLVAEGVETRRHAEILEAIGVETLQGYAFSRPVPAEDFARYLAKQGVEPVSG
ncbi:GGDEF and EAL domain-containing protein [Martelella alba]|uniref:GGDEF and EAL domain-containing protein n=1 Tax=Martelella alba TaxID=2590451 RepID=A0A506UGD4_9HYPH|nr:GGDEF and EAL domain-containing protein [Martelella alba]TPW32365.1 GGDEF and EAL domain-containing protein [Martelella alba]